MKTLFLISGLLVSTVAFAQEADSTGLEGDNLNLEAVLELFKTSDSPEDFEKKLNTENSNVNNLDLNDDGEVDYIRVIESGDSTAHLLTLQISVNEKESQDIATIELEETDEDVVEVQVVGDEELYGKNYILMPESAGHGPVIVNVIMWRPVRFMWGPRYVFWRSPWRYRAYPTWYRPWKRRSWGVYRRRVVVYRGGCRRVYRRSFTRGHMHFYHRTHSVTFHKTHHHKHVSKSTVVKPSAGNNGKVGNVGATKSNATPKKQSATKVKSSPKQSSEAKTASQAKARKTNTKQSQQKAVTKQRTKTNTSNTRKRPGTKSTSSKKRPSTSSGSKKGGGNVQRSSGKSRGKH